MAPDRKHLPTRLPQHCSTCKIAERTQPPPHAVLRRAISQDGPNPGPVPFRTVQNRRTNPPPSWSGHQILVPRTPGTNKGKLSRDPDRSDQDGRTRDTTNRSASRRRRPRGVGAKRSQWQSLRASLARGVGAKRSQWQSLRAGSGAGVGAKRSQWQSLRASLCGGVGAEGRAVADQVVADDLVPRVSSSPSLRSTRRLPPTVTEVSTIPHHWPKETDFALWELDVFDLDRPVRGLRMPLCDRRHPRLHSRRPCRTRRRRDPASARQASGQMLMIIADKY
jgi:hypothetical protein